MLAICLSVLGQRGDRKRLTSSNAPFPPFKLLKVLEKNPAARIRLSLSHQPLRAVRPQERVQCRDAQVRVHPLAVVAPEDHVAHAIEQLHLFVRSRLRLRSQARKQALEPPRRIVW